MTKDAQNSINQRAQHLLKVLIERYIDEGQPVGSKTLAEYPGLTVSSATIRNIMAELEHKGYLVSPHTSAGRIPTEQGFRFFVDSLLSVKPIEELDLAELQSNFAAGHEPKSVVKSASNLLSNFTHLAGLVTLPKREQMVLRQIEFLPLSQNRVLAILVVNGAEVMNTIFQTERHYSESQLQEAANFLNAHFSGREVTDVSHEVIDALKEDKASLTQEMQSVIDLATQAFQSPNEDEYVVAGEENLLDVLQDAEDKSRIKELLEAFTHKRDVLDLFKRCIDADGVQIFIGKEAGYDVFDQCSVVAAPYHEAGKIVGVLGVIGPTRLHYERVIPMVDMTAKLVSLALENKL